ncbi:MAG TPA: hypothetical protein DDY77_04030 [Clostridiales bacterium]|nr:hypothetical protein [Clostridiales bacterium]
MANPKPIKLSTAESGVYYRIMKCNFSKEEKSRLTELGFFSGNKLFVCFSKGFLVIKISSCRFFLSAFLADKITVSEAKAFL